MTLRRPPLFVLLVWALGAGSGGALCQRHPAPLTKPSPVESNNEALSLAIRRGDTALARTLVARGVRARQPGEAGDTLLHEAVVFSGDPVLVAALLRAGAPLQARDAFGDSPLQAALARAQYADDAQGTERLRTVVDLLLAAGAPLNDTPDRGDPAGFERVLQWRRPALLQRLLQRGLPLPDHALLRALEGADDPAGRECAALLLNAAQPRHLSARDAEGRTPAHRAVQRRDALPLLQGLAERGADLKALDDQGQSVFGAAAFAAHLPVLQWLAARGALNLQADAEGHTPLHLAAYEPRPEVLDWLRSRGADPQARDRRGRRALDIALATPRFAWRSVAEQRRLVQGLGGSADDLRRGRVAGHPLHQAVAAKDLKRAETVLVQGADANVRNEDGHTPLRAALEALAWPVSQDFGRQLLALLLRHGANPQLTLTEHEDETHLDLARRLRVLDRVMREQARHRPER